MVVLVLVLSVLLMGSLVAALGASNFAGTISTRYNNSNQASLAAQAGLAYEINAMRAVSVYTSLPCGSFSGSLSATGASSSYAGTTTYYPSGSNPSALTCSGSTLGGSTPPATATVTSKGTAPHGVPITLEEQVTIATTTTPAAALGYALYTANSLNLSGAAAVNSGSNNANVYSQGTLTCGTGDVIQGSVTTYAALTTSGTCTMASLTASTSVTLQNSTVVNGNVISYGGTISMSGSAKVNGNATETVGGITMTNGTVTGNAYAYGAISLSGGAQINGTQTPNDFALSSQTMPAAVSFPVLNPSVATWQGQSWNVIQIPGTVNGTSYSCQNAQGTTLGTGPNYFQSNSSGAADPFQTAIAALTGPTVFYAPTCSPSYTRSQTFSFAADAVLEVATLSLANSDTFASTTATHHDFSIMASPGTACSTSSTDITISNSASFASSLTVFMYSPGQVSYANNPSMTGQIVACGGITGSNSFSLTYDSQASSEIPGSSVASAPTETVTNKFVLH
ncbi:MAG TPA: polymer-forming cytoskeletal protein [Acidimicrobiales bacterium]|nr:polymer-forming cytoskeletal protein [Acidimicrobiales bacterium]